MSPSHKTADTKPKVVNRVIGVARAAVEAPVVALKVPKPKAPRRLKRRKQSTMIRRPLLATKTKTIHDLWRALMWEGTTMLSFEDWYEDLINIATTETEDDDEEIKD